jgi:hypothetical protein
LQDKIHRFKQVFSAGGFGFTLAICAGNFGAVSDKVFFTLLDDKVKLECHEVNPLNWDESSRLDGEAAVPSAGGGFTFLFGMRGDINS